MNNLSFSRKVVLFFTLAVGFFGVAILLLRNNAETTQQIQAVLKPTMNSTEANPLAIDWMRQQTYPGSDIVIEKTLQDGSNYHQYLVSYKSDGLKINGLLTVPSGEKPKTGWPVILFNHGYIAPQTYQTFPSVGQYATYYPVFAQAGYIVFKPDYRGNGDSEGLPEGAYYSPAYAVDDLNALASIKKYIGVDQKRIGIWGHSMGGNITLRDLVVNTKDVKAAVIWGGVVGSYTDLLYNWHHHPGYNPGPTEQAIRTGQRQRLAQKYGAPSSNPAFWQAIDPTYFVKDITVPIQLNVGGSDEEVPVIFSQELRDNLKKNGKTVEYYEYPGADHNIKQNFTEAMQHSLEFFNKYVKGGEQT